MNKLIKNILLSAALFAGLTTSFMSCGGNQQNNVTQNSNTNKTDREIGNRKPQVNMGDVNQSNESVYKDGEIVTLAEGTKLKYNANGNHEILEKGEGTVIIFKTVTQEDLQKLDPNAKAMVERQMSSDPNGFALIY